MIRHLTDEQIEQRLRWCYETIESTPDIKTMALMSTLASKLTDEAVKRGIGKQGAVDHIVDATDTTDKWATSLTESDVLNLHGIIAELRDMPVNDRESFLLQALAKRIEEML